jgi:Fe-S cluster assembly protein SufD
MTETTQDISRARYLKEVQSREANGSPEWLRQIRAEGAQKFTATPWPHTRMEEWRHTNIASINNTVFAPAPAPATLPAREALGDASFAHEGWVELVFVDGVYAPSLSSAARPAGVVAGGLYAAACGEHAPAVQAHLNRYLQDRNAYTALNSAFLQDGAFVHVAKNAAVDTPIHLLFVTTRRGASTAAMIRNLVVLEEGAQASVVTTYVSLAGDTPYLNNVVEEVAIGDNASLDYYRIVREGTAGNHLATVEFHHGRDARCRSYGFTLDGRIVRNELAVDLAGEGAECNLAGLYLNDGERLLDNALNITHRVANCRSRILYKGVLSGESKAVFAGRVHVHRDAQKTDSDQLSNNLLLSDSATIDAKPQLEIYADDVKCTHGATIGSFPDKVLFYFRARGINEEMARAMLTYGFAGEVAGEVELDALRDWLNGYIYDRYSPIR